ncbi:hypothetical protein I4U23_028327 [Adineta vaga]|nr:hypothetical protein I4U23_028327 [Adineta vaga]
MGNKNSRVTPAKSVQIFDTQTRTRYKNQRESNNLRQKLKKLGIQHHEELSRLAYDQHDAKVKLHELNYDKTQRELYRNIDKERPKSRSSVSNHSHFNDNPPNRTSSLLVHNLNESRRLKSSNISPKNPSQQVKQNRPLTAFENFELQYSSKADIDHQQINQNEKTPVTQRQSLQQETELMKKSIKIAVAKARRDSNMFARRDTLIC